MCLRLVAIAALTLSVLGCGLVSDMHRFPVAETGVGTVALLAATPAAPMSNGCSAPASGACAGCAVSCPETKAAYCASGLTDYSPTNTGHAPVCRRPAYCYCS